MPNVPKYKKVKTVRHQWVIGTEERDTDAKEYRLGVELIYKDMIKLGIDLSYDDAFYVRAGDGGEIIFYVDKQEKS